VNLAYQLARMGGRIGLLDLDLFGPSLPVLVRPEDTTVRRSPLGEGMVLPIEHENVKLLSLGYVNVNVSSTSGPRHVLSYHARDTDFLRAVCR
jgi:Mrp family chromosome partitioning ATPase